MKRWKKRWVILVGIGAFTVTLWNTVGPRLAMSSALPKLVSQLEERFRGDPILMAAEQWDPEGRYSADVLLSIGQNSCALSAQTDWSDHQFYAEGTVGGMDKAVDIRLYLDDTIAAAASEALTNGTFYGITYNSLASDIQKQPILSALVSETVLSQWTVSAERLQKAVSWEYPHLPCPVFSDWNAAPLSRIAALPCSRENVSVPVYTELLSCIKLHYFLDGGHLQSVFETALWEDCPTDADISADFYLYRGSIVKCFVRYQQGSDRSEWDITFGKDPLRSPITVEISDQREGESRSYQARIEMENQGERRKQTIRYSHGQSKPAVCAYQWDASTGSIYLETGAGLAPAEIRLSRENTGLRLETSDIAPLLRMLTGNAAAQAENAACTVSIRRGSNIQAPNYKAMESWSFEDLLLLFGGLGSLTGWDFVQ